jgi:hypothetical protein
VIGIPKPRARILDKRDEKRERERQVRELNRAIAERDSYRCRCCGREGQYDATQADRALHRHHVRYRSKGGEDATKNLVTLCAYCHAAIHARQLWIVGDNADQRLTFEVHEAAVIDLFGTKPLPASVHIVTERRR